ncbi:ATP-binding protein [Shimwellia blattae]|uniref:ATPase n=1 Tax=Shimwellia blattae (strain ATCC 29907 / DSM 4481 / JCM 1650 / NBRC 105725 / CDC 9005-74) TaxID=630626 RepID=I2B9G8_SHIBC|nr:ATP-binding protein [Shimwellia blattae]AFJ47172.1 ATPase [Shimwellia blattae DSM 4481 = NBRC 105725]GAB82297.1 hypothetical protein EB105725_21_00950 [Shimwellia blattae DSM 4481 = NBRC 105725]VDY64664.1 two-component sensor protein [Shimwellia blattae]VEC22769.1 two-component sensor protein [Shimwellia blattae]
MTQIIVRARAVDMLGRQQIAGIPTAIHELFKNAHDAYAENVEVDYFQQNKILILRDNGYGMTRQDVESRWLTLGTESRINYNKKLLGKDEWRGPKALASRAIMGEKGIGRLAIAVISPITLLMTRAVREDGLHNLVVALVHWGLFEQPGIDISAINIPVEEYDGGYVLNNSDITVLVDKVEKNIDDLKNEIDLDEYNNLKQQLSGYKKINPDAIDKMLREKDDDSLSLRDGGYGTHFILLPVAPELDDDIEGGTDKEASKLERSLLGFSNLMLDSKPVIKTEFRIHRAGEVEELIGGKIFFENSDFDRTDQFFEGEFNEYGQFVGVVSIYGKKREFIYNWVDGKGRQSKCGAFSFKYGYVQGVAHESRLTPDEWTNMSRKTDRIGGLYIYKNGIRVLPYGNSDVDWLDIEKRRTQSFRDWFFSYRRGFGYVAITQENNETLSEKAGREGFRENQAYRDFRSILIGLFRQLAIEFFRKSGAQTDDFNEIKDLYKKQNELLKKQKAKVENRRKDFQSELDDFFELYNKNHFEDEVLKIDSYCSIALQQLEFNVDISDFGKVLRDIEREVNDKYKKLNSQLTIVQPRGLALTNRLKNDWFSYEDISSKIREDLINKSMASSLEKIAELSRQRIPLSERRNNAIADIQNESDKIIKDIMAIRRSAATALKTMTNSVNEVIKSEFSRARVDVELIIDEFVKKSAQRPSEIELIRNDINGKINALYNNELVNFSSIKSQLDSLIDDIKSKDTYDDKFAAIEARNQILEEQIEFYSEFAQMGMSVGILQHEFESSIKGIRSAMVRFKPWADKNAPLSPIYMDLRVHIERLDGYLKALDPLGRRMHRQTIELSGSEIIRVVKIVFTEQLDKHKIVLEISHAFRDFTVKCKSSAIIGAFINIVDNAIYWLSHRVSGDRIIYFDADIDGFLLSNNGPGIEDRYRDRIFNFGETLKEGGRGMGLAITKQTLKNEGFDISLIKAGIDVNPVFKIHPVLDKEI